MNYFRNGLKRRDRKELKGLHREEIAERDEEGAIRPLLHLVQKNYLSVQTFEFFAVSAF